MPLHTTVIIQNATPEMVDTHFNHWAWSLWLAILPIKMANTSSVDGWDYAAK